MVFKNKTLQPGIPFLEKQRCRQPAYAAPDDNTVEDFTCVDYVLRKREKDVIADLVAGGYHLLRVPVGPRIVTHAAVAGPVVASEELLGCQGTEKRAARSHQDRIHEIAAANPLVQPKRLVVSLALSQPGHLELLVVQVLHTF